MVHINIDDFSANPDHPEFGKFGRVEVWFGKGTQGSEKKHRTVWITDLETVEILQWYVTEIRPQFIGRKTKDEDFRALFFSERGNRISERSIQVNLKTYLNLFNMPTDGSLVPHSLRHSYVTNEQEDNDVSAHFIQRQAGHEFLSTTQGYTHFSDDYYRKLLNDTIEKKLQKRRERENNEKDPLEGRP